MKFSNTLGRFIAVRNKNDARFLIEEMRKAGHVSMSFWLYDQHKFRNNCSFLFRVANGELHCTGSSDPGDGIPLRRIRNWDINTLPPWIDTVNSELAWIPF